MTVFKTDTNHT